MLAKYVCLATATMAQIQTDLVALACGASIDALSASCDKAASVILANTEMTGWSLIDAAGPSTGKVMTAKDAANNDKIVNIAQYNANSLLSYSYDTYNVGTHTGTNQSGIYNNLISFTPGNAQTYYVYATQKNLLFMNNTGSSVIGSMEFTREAPFLSSNLYPAHAIMGYWGYGTAVTIPRLKNMGAVGDQLNLYNKAMITTINGNSFPGYYRDANDVVTHPAFEAYIAMSNEYNNLPLGKLYDTLLSSNSLGTFMDTVVIDEVTYFIVPNAQYARVLLKLG